MNSQQSKSIVPLSISKVRKQAFVEYYEVIWSKMKRNNSWNDEDLSDLNEYKTLEKPETFEIYFPHLVEEFKQRLNEKKKPKSKNFLDFFLLRFVNY